MCTPREQTDELFDLNRDPREPILSQKNETNVHTLGFAPF